LLKESQQKRDLSEIQPSLISQSKTGTTLAIDEPVWYIFKGACNESDKSKKGVLLSSQVRFLKA
jgi:hypothetical protein